MTIASIILLYDNHAHFVQEVWSGEIDPVLPTELVIARDKIPVRAVTQGRHLDEFGRACFDAGGDQEAGFLLSRCQ